MATQVFIHDSVIAFTSTIPSNSVSALDAKIVSTWQLLRTVMLTVPFVSFFWVQNAARTQAFFQFVFADGRQFDATQSFLSAADSNPNQSTPQNTGFTQDERMNLIEATVAACISMRTNFGATAVIAVTPQYELLQVPIIVAPQNALAQVGKRFLYQIVSLGFPTAWAATGMPPSLSIEPTTGVITGVPKLTEAGPYLATLSATNSFGTSSVPLALAVEAPPVITSPTTLTVAMMSQVSYQITASGFPTSFGTSQLPPHLTVNATTGLISGQIIPRGTFQITLSATNADGTGTATLALTSV